MCSVERPPSVGKENDNKSNELTKHSSIYSQRTHDKRKPAIILAHSEKMSLLVVHINKMCSCARCLP